MKRILTPEDVEQICKEAREPGATLLYFATTYRVSRERIRQVLRNHGIVLPRKGPNAWEICPVCPICGKPRESTRMFCSHVCRLLALPNNRPGERLCSMCGEWKPLSEYGSNGVRVNLSSRCKRCQYKAARASYLGKKEP